MSSLVADAPKSATFYAEELIRCWNPDPAQRVAIWFYAALWAIGSFDITDPRTDPWRSRAFGRAAQSWLSLAEAYHR